MGQADNPGYTERKLALADGTVLHLARHAPTGPCRGTLIMLHGFSVHCGRYQNIAAAFAQSGLSVTAFDSRGHGLSTGRRGHVERFSDFLDDLQAVIQDACRVDGPGPVAIVGHSHGATVALAYALENRSALAALVLAAPWLSLKLKVPAWKLALSAVVGRVWPALALGNELNAEDTTRDPATRERLRGDTLVHHVATPRWFNEVRAAQTYIVGHASTLKVPTLLAVAGDDRIVSTEAALAFARDAGAVVEVKEYENMFHELFLEPDWRRIVEDFASWVVARLPGSYTSIHA